MAENPPADSAVSSPNPTDKTDASIAPDVAAAAAGIDAAPREVESDSGAAPQAAAQIASGGADADSNDLNAIDHAAIEELLKQAEFDDASAVADESSIPGAEAFKLPSFQQVMADAQVSSIDLLRDVELNVKIELGRSRMLVEDVLKLSEGSVVELDKLAGDPVDVFVNERLVARGEVLVLNDNFCVRVNEIVAGIKEEGL